MNIGLIIYGSLDTLSGGYLHDRKLVEYLRARGDTVEIISLTWRNYAVLRRCLDPDVNHFPVQEMLMTKVLGSELKAKVGDVGTQILDLYGQLRHLSLGPARGWYLAGWAEAGLGVITKGVGFLPILILVRSRC